MTTPGVLLILTTALMPAPGIQDEQDPALREELRRHQGAWAVERSVRDGQDGPAEVIREIIRRVDGDRVVWRRGDDRFAATRFELDPESEPKAIDLIPEGGPNRGDRVLGIYRFEGEGEEARLVICTADPGRPRPSAFAAEPGSGTTLMTFRRVEPGPGDTPPPDSP